MTNYYFCPDFGIYIVEPITVITCNKIVDPREISLIMNRSIYFTNTRDGVFGHRCDISWRFDNKEIHIILREQSVHFRIYMNKIYLATKSKYDDDNMFNSLEQITGEKITTFMDWLREKFSC